MNKNRKIYNKIKKNYYKIKKLKKEKFIQKDYNFKYFKNKQIIN